MSKHKLYKANLNFTLLFVSDQTKKDLKEEALEFLKNDLDMRVPPNALLHDEVKLTEITTTTQVPAGLKDYSLWGKNLPQELVTAKDFLSYLEEKDKETAKDFLSYLEEKDKENSREYKKYLELKKKFEPKQKSKKV
jgi:hypothetical protein